MAVKNYLEFLILIRLIGIVSHRQRSMTFPSASKRRNWSIERIVTGTVPLYRGAPPSYACAGNIALCTTRAARAPAIMVSMSLV